MAEVAFPPGLVPAAINFNIDWRNKTGGGRENLEGETQVIDANRARWVATLTYPLNNRTRVLAHQALLARMKGRLNWTAVPHCTGKQAPRVLPRINGKVYEGNKLVLPSGQTYADLGVKPTLAASAAAGADQLVINRGTTIGIEPGLRFSIVKRMYVIEDMHGDTLKIAPRLRFALTVNSAVEFWKPVCLMTLVDDTSGWADLQFNYLGEPQINFVEYL